MEQCYVDVSVSNRAVLGIVLGINTLQPTWTMIPCHHVMLKRLDLGKLAMILLLLKIVKISNMSLYITKHESSLINNEYYCNAIIRYCSLTKLQFTHYHRDVTFLLLVYLSLYLYYISLLFISVEHHEFVIFVFK